MPLIRARLAAGLMTVVVAVAGAGLATSAASAADPITAPFPAASPSRSDASTGPNLAEGIAYLVDPANLLNGHYYEAFAGSGFADYGITIDGALALAAVGTDDSTLAGIVAFIDGLGTDGVGNSINDWTGIGTPYVSGGSLGKEALLAEGVGRNPRQFGGQDVIAALAASVCTAATTGVDFTCAAVGNYAYTASVFSQAIAVMAQLRAGDGDGAKAPIAYLESLQHDDGSFPSVIPSAGDSDVDSTAMAAMALALVSGDASATTADKSTAATAVDTAIAWIATRQGTDGGFLGAAGDSTNSAALAILGLRLAGAAHQARIDAALGFLAGRQNADGGFEVASDGQPGSDVRASTQALSAAIGISFGVLTHVPGTGPTRTPTPIPTKPPIPTPTVTVTRISRITTTTTATATVTATVTVRAAPVPSTGSPATIAPGIAPSLSPSPNPSPSLPPNSSLNAAARSTTINGLWWVVAIVAIVVAALIAALFRRRGRVGAHTAKAGS